MKIWKVKAVAQKIISFLPFKHKINYLFQKYVTKGVRLTDALMEDKLIHCKNHLQYFLKYGKKKEGFTTLEIGTGWYPIVPIGFYLAGAGEIYTIDVSDLLKTKAIHETIKKYHDWYVSGKLNLYLPDIKMERLEKLNSLLSLQNHPHQILEQINIHTIIGDARKTKFNKEEFDLINSNNTFEHIYPGILTAILKEFKRILKADGIMSHSIDMSDHFAHLDKSITVYNYLQYSDTAWQWIDNTIQPQNRLRVADYRKLHTDTGFKILEEINRPGSMEDLKQIKIAEKYRHYSKNDMAVSHCLIVSSKG